MRARGRDTFASFAAYYPYYLGEHGDINCRRLHFAGTSLVIATAVYTFATTTWWLLALLPLFGFGFAWTGHFLCEKNMPGTFRHPIYSIAGDFVMFRDVLIGKVRI
jgi:hypothetical protein